ncbi:MAG: 2-C-methyl-D-erythritol 2,4-cyclodiphosphate synthase, partial [Fimbriimonadaceae bacterium]|nr:2-C-methyl-D-erythritol 2,4-cyclodiphosphate synthase [Fimbriimonadaceae bacterium]
SHPRCDRVVVSASAALEPIIRAARPDLTVVAGGSSRQESCRIALEAAGPEATMILVHDAARPFASPALIDRLLDAAEETGAAFPGVAVVDTIRQREGSAWTTLERDRLTAVQTPQAIRADLFREAHARASRECTDDAALVMELGHAATMVPGEPGNIKVTHPGDLPATTMEFRTGIGFDIHRFSSDPDRPMWLGGVEFPEGRPGLEGHSDADALIHAVVDAILGAAGLGDIGCLFPNDDPRWKDMRSARFLEEAVRRAAADGWEVRHVDVAVVAERPKIMKRSAEIRAALAGAMGIGPDRVSVKATTNEGLGSLGRGEGISATAVATLARST